MGPVLVAVGGIGLALLRLEHCGEIRGRRIEATDPEQDLQGDVAITGLDQSIAVHPLVEPCCDLSDPRRLLRCTGRVTAPLWME